MDRTERFYKIDHLIRDRGVVPVADFLRELEVPLATFKRDIEYMRSRHHAPIECDRDADGYRFVKPDSAAPVYELRFTPERARYVAMEEWHPKQRARWEKHGSYILDVPYSSEAELLMDILKFGADVEVTSPSALRESARNRSTAATRLYAK